MIERSERETNEKKRIERVWGDGERQRTVRRDS